MLARQDFSTRATGVSPVPSQPLTRPPGAEGVAGSPRAARLRSAIVTAVLIALLWAALHGVRDPSSWVIGGPVVLGAAGVVLLLPATTPPHLSPAGTLRFCAFAISGVLSGAAGVALSALRPSGLTPGHLFFRTRLPDGRPRRLFAIAITMLPGTLTTRLDGDLLSVHALDLTDEVDAELRRLESKIAGLYGLTLDGDDA